MKIRTKLLISVAAGLLALTLRTTPMWWGVLFDPLSRPLLCEAVTEDTDGFCWQYDGVVLRFKSLDLLLSFLRRS